MHRSLVLAVALSLSMPAAAHTQAVSPAAKPANDSLFRRARKLVSEGNGTAGRALVDSLLAAAPPGSADFGNALYWHGALAQTAAEAEHDYRRVIVEFPLAYYADDALLAMAELEQARGDRAAALAHLQRFVREHPASSARGIAALGAARLAFEQRDTKTACAMIGEARASASAGNVELKNQIGYYAGRCPEVAAPATAVAAAPAQAVAAPVAAAPAQAAAAPVAAAPAQAVAASVAASAEAVAAPVVAARADTQTAPLATPMAKPATTRAAAPAPARVSRPATAKAPANAPARATPVAKQPAAHGRYTIQLAAFSTQAEATRLVAKLKSKKLNARVSGSAKPFRVRLGYYGTRAAAQSEVSSLKARGIIGFAVEEP